MVPCILLAGARMARAQVTFLLNLKLGHALENLTIGCTYPLNIESAVISEEEIADDTAVCLVCFYLKSSQVE